MKKRVDDLERNWVIKFSTVERTVSKILECCKNDSPCDDVNKDLDQHIRTQIMGLWILSGISVLLLLGVIVSLFLVNRNHVNENGVDT